MAAGGVQRSMSGPWRRVRRVLKWLALGGVATLAVAAVAGWLVLRRYEAGLPSIADVKGNYRPPQVTRVLARDGSLLAEIFTERRTLISIATLPPHVKLAVLAAEDAAFYEHEGLNYWGVLRALAVNLRAGRTVQGGSTITQQVVKNIVLDPERSLARKIREAILATRLEEQVSKDEILELYLNHIYFGHGRYGIEEAARYYFGKHARELSLGEAAMLAGLVASPESYSPRHDMNRAAARKAFVLGQMLEKGFIGPRQHDAALNEPIRLAPAVEPQAQLAPEVLDVVKRTLSEVARGPDAKISGGFTVTTTIDPGLQAAARKAVRDNLSAYDKRYKLQAPFSPPKETAGKKKKKARVRAADRPFEGTPKYTDHKILNGVVIGADDAAGVIDVQVGTVAGSIKLADYERYNPKNLAPTEFAADGSILRVSLLAPAPPPGETKAKVPLRLELGPEAAMVAIDVRSREVLALVGSYEAVAGGLDRATQAHRQPGSAFKPFVYSYAIYARRVTPATMLETSRTSLATDGYRPNNYEDSEGNAPVRLREALAHSVNVAAVHVLEQVGPANVVAWAGALGIGSRLGADLSLALGSYEVTPYEMAAAYSTFASGGVYEAPTLIARIVGPDGRDIPLPPRPPARRVMSEADAYVITSLLGSVVDHGTAAAARSLGRPVAGKTGTSNRAKDAWFVGYSSDITCATWTGYDDGRPLGSREAGATAALPAWISFMRAAHENKPHTEFPRPAGIVTARIDPATGLLAYAGETDAIDEIFLEGTEPHEVSVPDAGVAADAGVVPGGAEPTTEVEEVDAGPPSLPPLPAQPAEPPPF
jgi:penicillin-binding protein 1A